MSPSRLYSTRGSRLTSAIKKQAPGSVDLGMPQVENQGVFFISKYACPTLVKKEEIVGKPFFDAQGTKIGMITYARKIGRAHSGVQRWKISVCITDQEFIASLKVIPHINKEVS